jgi:hypothetical protein
MKNLSASDITKLTCMIDGQPRGRLATTAKTVDRLRKTLADAIGNPLADSVIDRAMVCETYGGAEAILKGTFKVGTGAAPAATIIPTPPPAAASWPTPAAATQRRRISITAAAEAAKGGTLPTPPDFAAPTNARFRTKLEGLIALAERGDIDALRAFAINPVSSSPKALARYRDLCIAALEARSPGKA